MSHTEAKTKMKKWLSQSGPDQELSDLNEIAEYIALENAQVARALVHRVFSAVERLGKHPSAGKPLSSYHTQIGVMCLKAEVKNSCYT